MQLRIRSIFSDFKRIRGFEKLLVIVVGLFLLFNILGFVIEIFFTFGIFNSEVVNVRKLGVLSGVLSLGFIFSGLYFLYKLLRSSKKSVSWWNIFIAIGLIIGFGKFIKPTTLSVLIPFYNYILLIIIVLIWVIVFRYLRKSKKDI